MVFKACHDPLVLCRFYAVGNMILVPQWFIVGLFGYGIWKANRSEIYPPDIQVTWRLYTFQMVLWNVGVSPLLEGCIGCLFLSKRPESWRGKFTALTMMDGDFPGQFLYPNSYGKSPFLGKNPGIHHVSEPGPSRRFRNLESTDSGNKIIQHFQAVASVMKNRV